MYLKSLYLRNFRNYSDAAITFSPRINVITGENAKGKTSILEAIYLLSTGRSFRTLHLSDMIQHGKTFFFVKAELIKDGMTQSLILHFDGKSKKFQYNSNLYLSFNNLLGILPSVLHEPSDIQLITGSPATRRRFMNIHIAQHDPLYVHHLVRFFKSMKQRNFLLKSKNISAIDCWESEMAASGAYLTSQRSQMLEELKKNLNDYSTHLSGENDNIDIQFISSIKLHTHLKQLKESYAEELRKNRSRELSLGNSIIGPHRDDFLITINQTSAKTFASEGQKRSSIAALRFSEWDHLCSIAEEAAIMSIDDLGVQLDDVRQMLMQKSLNKFLQVFITTPYDTKKWQHMENVKTFSVQNGEVSEI